MDAELNVAALGQQNEEPKRTEANTGMVGQLWARLTSRVPAKSSQHGDKSIEAELRRIEMHERLLSSNQFELERRADRAATSRRFTFSGKSRPSRSSLEPSGMHLAVSCVCWTQPLATAAGRDAGCSEMKGVHVRGRLALVATQISSTSSGEALPFSRWSTLNVTPIGSSGSRSLSPACLAMHRDRAPARSTARDEDAPRSRAFRRPTHHQLRAQRAVG